MAGGRQKGSLILRITPPTVFNIGNFSFAEKIVYILEVFILLGF